MKKIAVLLGLIATAAEGLILEAIEKLQGEKATLEKANKILTETNINLKGENVEIQGKLNEALETIKEREAAVKILNDEMIRMNDVHASFTKSVEDMGISTIEEFQKKFTEFLASGSATGTNQKSTAELEEIAKEVLESIGAELIHVAADGTPFYIYDDAREYASKHGLPEPTTYKK